ncbi:MAG: hypothetical protein IJY15_08870 [Thermoguttaceae bacterium]|nr:hypothetical protein [Thermoguttaceae bacterium]MBQ9127854.1 hypothetical protein [Thermoguttaceae bacterium]
MRKKKSQAPFSLFAFQDAIASVCGLVVLITLILAVELTQKIIDEASSPPPTKTDVAKLTNEIATLKSNLATLAQTLESQTKTAREASQTAFSLESAENERREAERRLAELLAESERLQALIADDTATQTRRAELVRDVETQNAEIAVLDAKIANLVQQNSLPPETSVFYASSGNVRETPWLVEVSARQIVARPLASPENTRLQPQKFTSGNAKSAFLTWARQRDKNAEYFVLLFRPSGVAQHDDLRKSLEEAGFKIGVDLVGETQTIEIAR